MNKKFPDPDAKKLIFILPFVVYLLLGSGIIADDFKFIADHAAKKAFINMPVFYFTHGIFLDLIGINRAFIYDFLKIIYLYLCFLMMVRFFSIFHNGKSAVVLSFLILFFPLHDSTAYWFTGQHLTLTLSIYMYAYYLAYYDKIYPAIILAFVASFISYGSTPVALAMSFLFLLQKQRKKSAAMLFPNIVYICYFILTSLVMKLGVERIPEAPNYLSIAKQFMLQVFTFLDTTAGPSLFLKVFTPFLNLTGISITVAAILSFLFLRFYSNHDSKYKSDRNLCLAFSLLLLTALIMFAITGGYPQIAFGVGNRVTIYSSVLFIYLIFTAPCLRKISTVITVILFFSIIGTSDHWKSWNAHQKSIMNNISSNEYLVNYKGNKDIYVSGNQYSKLGGFSHIDFFTAGFVVEPFFKMSLQKDIPVSPINKNFRYQEGFLIDKKNNVVYAIDGYILAYDSQNDRVFKVDGDNINNFIDSLPPDKRHWIQMIDNKTVQEMIIKLMPRLRYTL